MDQSWHTNLDFTRKMFEEGKKTAEEMKEALTPYCLKDMMAKAQEMYNFVSKKE